MRSLSILRIKTPPSNVDPPDTAVPGAIPSYVVATGWAGYRALCKLLNASHLSGGEVEANRNYATSNPRSILWSVDFGVPDAGLRPLNFNSVAM